MKGAGRVSVMSPCMGVGEWQIYFRFVFFSYKVTVTIVAGCGRVDGAW